MNNEMVKIRLLNDGCYTPVEVNFPVEVDGYICTASGCAKIKGCEMILVGWGDFIDPDWSYAFSLLSGEYELVTPTYNKPLIDSVNALQGDVKNTFLFLSGDKFLSKGLVTGYVTYKHKSSASTGIICTIEEFNQCVEAMMTNGNYNEFYSYVASSKQPLTKENSDYSFYGGKSVVKVEYVKVVYSGDRELASIFINEKIYYMTSNSHDTHGTSYKEISTIDELACAANFYRKVETEISPEELLVEQVANNVREHCSPNYQKKDLDPAALHLERTLELLNKLGHLK